MQGGVGTQPQEIGKIIKRDRRSVQSSVNKINYPNPFTPNHNQIGRWKTGGTKFADRHKVFINRWVLEQTVQSAKKPF